FPEAGLKAFGRLRQQDVNDAVVDIDDIVTDLVILGALVENLASCRPGGRQIRTPDKTGARQEDEQDGKLHRRVRFLHANSYSTVTRRSASNPAHRAPLADNFLRLPRTKRAETALRSTARHIRPSTPSGRASPLHCEAVGWRGYARR